MFTYQRATDIDHALELLGAAGDDLKVLAGGQSLLPMINLGLARPNRLLDIGGVDALGETVVDQRTVRLGALVRHAQLERPGEDVRRAAPLLPNAARLIGHTAIRERGTFGGSLAHGDPAAEWPAVVVALNATLVLRSTRGERRLPASDFYVGPLTTRLEADELLVAAEWVPAGPRTGVAVEELTYRHGDYAVVGVVAQISRGQDGRLSAAHIALFGVGGTPIRAAEAEAILTEGGIASLPDAAAAAEASCDPSSDVTASATYRREMVAVFTRRAVEAAHRRASLAAERLPNV